MGKSSNIKAEIIRELLTAYRSKSEIISMYSKQSSKGIYRHLRDLEKQKVIKEIRSKGSKTILSLNDKNLQGMGIALEYLVKCDPNVRDAFNVAFAECAISAYGDFPYWGRGHEEANELVMPIILNFLETGNKPKLSKENIEKIATAIKIVRGNMSTREKLGYISIVYLLSAMKRKTTEAKLIDSCVSFVIDPLLSQNESLNSFENEIRFQWPFIILKIINMANGHFQRFIDDSNLQVEKGLLISKLIILQQTFTPINEIVNLYNQNKI